MVQTMTIYRIFPVIFLLLCSASCRKSDVRVHTIRVSEMSSETDAIMIKSVLTGMAGVPAEKIHIDLSGPTVSYQYDSMMTAHKNVEILIAGLGFSANKIPADPAAAERRPFLKDLRVRVPDMANPQVANQVIGSLNGLPGVVPRTVRFYGAAQEVSMIADLRTLSLPKLERSISKMGFRANSTPADPKARAALPPAMRSQPQPFAPAGFPGLPPAQR